jgi:hypothetical protein
LYNHNSNYNNISEGTILKDSIVKLTRKIRGKNKINNNNNNNNYIYKDNIRQVIVKRDRSKHKTDLILYTNDFNKTAEEIANLYKNRWEIELFFKWIKQNLKIKKFLGKNENAIKTQICIALISFVLIKLAQIVQTIAKKINITTLMTIIRCNLFTRVRIIDPNKYKKQKDPNQLQFAFMYENTG